MHHDSKDVAILIQGRLKTKDFYIKLIKMETTYNIHKANEYNEVKIVLKL
jgi:hypothetical protein